MSHNTDFDPQCSRCPRLAAHLEEVRREFPAYHGRPVAPFGAEDPRLLIVGLAPGLHGANATGRPFTGDFAGILLYKTLFEYGLSNRGSAVSRDDDLCLRHCRITNAVKCLPPQNKPNGAEIAQCNTFLAAEIAALRPGATILALGTIAHNAVLRALQLKLKDHPFGHGHEHALPQGCLLIDSYHCSRYNTQTRRLTEAMFRAVFDSICARLRQTDEGPQR
ncbi:MAG: uracil-DNA glycosylase [Gammaproteobacteria bacterium]